MYAENVNEDPWEHSNMRCLLEDTIVVEPTSVV